jgi:hypothetical protein
MSLILIKPYYRSEPIRSIAALARSLRFDVDVLEVAAARANSSYRRVIPAPGSTRETFDAQGILKVIHRRIKDTIFVNVEFPDYLQGSLKQRDYVSNARKHVNQQILICEDVKKFFPSVLASKVEDVWCAFFGFSLPVAQLLTQLTTKDGSLPQGAITSSYLANLVLWRDEPLLHAKMAEKGITYSRYVDDMVMSSKKYLSKSEQAWAIAQVYGMLRKNSLSAGRNKHEIFSATKPMIATKLIVNRKPSLPHKKRSKIRAQIRQLEQCAESGSQNDALRELAGKASQSVGQLGRFHPNEAGHLKERIQAVRNTLSMSTEGSFAACSPLMPIAHDFL